MFAEKKIDELGYLIVELKNANDVSVKNLGANYVQLCNNVVTRDFASSLYETEQNLKAVKLVKKGEEKKAVAMMIYVDPMRAYDETDPIAKKFTENSKRLGFDQRNVNDAIEIVVFCVEKDLKNKELASLLLLHSIDQSWKKFIVVGQDLGPDSEQATNFFTEIFKEKSFETKRSGGTVRFYVSTTEDAVKNLQKNTTPAKFYQAEKSVSKKRRSTATCGKVVRRSDSFLNAIGKLFKDVKQVKQVKSTLSSKAACILDAILRETLEKIGEFSSSLLTSKKSKTLDRETARLAIKSIFKNGQVAHYMILEGAKAFKNMKEKKNKSRTVRAGLKVAPARVARLLRKARVAPRFQENVDVFIAGALEYIAIDIIETSLELIAQNKKKIVRLNPRILKLTISGDDDLRPFFQGIIGGGGVMPSQNLEKKRKINE